MLRVLLRNGGLVLVIGVTACSFGSTPIGKGTSNSSASKRRDAGEDLDAMAISSPRNDDDDDDDAGSRETDASSEATRDAGENDRAATGGPPESRDQAAGDHEPDEDQSEQPDSGMTTTHPSTDAGPQSDASPAGADDPITDLEELARMAPSSRTAATIDQFLMTLRDGDAPASSITEFLTAINDEVDCKMNPLAYECITACGAVGTTCALCILEEECRMTMLEICGLASLAGCR